MSAKIAFIGAGSVVFTKNLLGDILGYPELRDVEIALHDIDADRLETAAAMARYVASVRGASPTITSHLDRRSALDGADYVLNMVQIGGHPSTLVDFELPARFGLRQTIADTLGIGGIFRVLRTADHMLALGNELAELCPSGWLLNYTNPMAALCWLAAPTNWPQFSAYYQAKKWKLVQLPTTQCGGRSVDFNLANGVEAEYGQFGR